VREGIEGMRKKDREGSSKREIGRAAARDEGKRKR
jgi:hypothetical protein